MKPQRVLITGASSGIGRQLTLDYRSKGSHTIACGRNRDRLLATQAEQTLLFDVEERRAVLSAATQITAPIDILILNAGSCEYIDDALAFDAKLFQRVINTNLLGVAYCLEAFLPKLASGGRIALMGSAVTSLPFSRAQAYGASKAGVKFLCDSLRVDLEDKGLTVSLIKPGFVDTPLTAKNTFAMPGAISTETASRAIISGIDKRKKTIRTPWLFNVALEFLGSLPPPLPTFIAKKLKNS